MKFRHALLVSALCLLAAPARAATRLVWIVPDGFRSDGSLLDVFKLAKEGQLPNIKKLMDEGAWGYSIPAFPSHTPVNFATLMTGAYPERHGISDGPMRVEGFPLAKPSVSGFSSNAKRVPPIWKTLENDGLKVTVLSVPGSTPPELDLGTVIRGRWGGWGADLPALNFVGSKAALPKPGLGARLFYLGPALTRFPRLLPAQGFGPAFASKAPALELPMLAYGTSFYAYVSGGGDAASPRYGEVSLSLDKKTVLARLSSPDQWTPWFDVTLHWQGRAVPTHARVCLVKLSPDGSVKLRILFDVLNELIAQPAGAADDLEAAVGPMVDFPDNWPAQLNKIPEDKAVLISEANMALDWHRRAIAHLLTVDKPDVLIQDTYVPNQMLESRWFLKHVDPAAPAYAASSPALRKQSYEDLLTVYKGIDALVGEALKNAPGAVIALSSDHGILPIQKDVLFNNLLKREGLLKFTIDPNTGEPVIDWAHSQAAFLKMIGVYVNPNGLAGPWHRGSGPAYEALRKRVTALLMGVKDGKTPVVKRVVPYEKARLLRLPPDRCPDLVLSMTPGYALTEAMDDSGDVLRPAVQSGYKQAVEADSQRKLWTPFVIAGPGIKKGLRLRKPIHHADQEPTLLKALGLPIPAHVQGRAVEAVFK